MPKAIRRLVDAKIDLLKVTVSSDANGSIPNGGVSRIHTLFDDIADCMADEKIGTETAVRLATQNVAELLKIYPSKGALFEGSDADILITDSKYRIKKLFCLGEIRRENECLGRCVNEK